jgi:SNF2 family DNA or RNA helicase
MKRKASSDALMTRMRKKSDRASSVKRVGVRAKGPSQTSVGPLLRPIGLVLREMRRINDPALVYRSPLATALEYAEDASGHLLRNYLALQPLEPLWSFQREAVDFLVRRESDPEGVGCRGAMLCDEMGLGKSKDALTAILEQNQRAARISGRRFNGTTLIICRHNLIQNWVTELQTFPRDAFEYLILKRDHGDYQAHHFEHCCDIVFLTYSAVVALHRRRHKPGGDLLFGVEWHRVIADESHVFAVAKTEHAIAMFQLRAHIKWILSGTPTRNRRSDMVTMLRFIGVPGVSGSSNLASLCERVLLRRTRESLGEGEVPTFQSVTRRIQLVEFATVPERVLYYLYAKYALRRHSSAARGRTSVIQLIQLLRQLCINPGIVKGLVLPGGLLTIGGSTAPDLFPVTDARAMPDEALTLREFMSQWVNKAVRITYSEGEAYAREGEQVSPSFLWDPLHNHGWVDEDREHYKFLFQECCRTEGEWGLTEQMFVKGPESRTKEMLCHIMDRTLRLDQPSSKERAVLRYVAETPNEDKLIIYSNYVAVLVSLDRLLRLCGVRTVLVTGQTNRPEVNDTLLGEFTCNEGIKVLLITLKLGSEGLNMSAANHILIVDPWWNPFIMEQAEHRVQRAAQRKAIFIVYFIMDHTIELYMLRHTMRKKQLLTNLLEGGAEEDDGPVLSAKEASLLFDYRVEVDCVV